MYVCKRAYLCVYVYGLGNNTVYMFVYVCTCLVKGIIPLVPIFSSEVITVRVCVCMYVSVCVYLCVCMYVCMCICMCTSVC